MWNVQSSGRLDEMSGGKKSLRIELQQDGDICLYIDEDGCPIQDEKGNVAMVEFCNTSGGGGRSPHTRTALRALFDAMRKDAEESGTGIPPYPFYLAEEMRKK